MNYPVMESVCIDLEAVTRLEKSEDPNERAAGRLLGKHLEKLLRGQQKQARQLAALRRDLKRLQPGPERQTLADIIREYVEEHNQATADLCNAIGRESRPL